MKTNSCYDNSLKVNSFQHHRPEKNNSYGESVEDIHRLLVIQAVTV